MLVSAYRDGPLRHGLSKGYVVVTPESAQVTEAVVGDASVASALAGHHLRMHGDPRRPSALWIATGPVWLADPEARARLLTALTDAVVTVTDAVARRGGLLLPCAAQAGARDRWSWLCEDRHSVEIVNERQREVCSNLFRRYAPELIALSGRAAFSERFADSQGSRRLADASDQVPARFIASASEVHLGRVREALRRDEGVSRLDVMDVNPLGDAGAGMPSVEVRCIDAQAFPATTVSHAVLLQALVMQGRRLEREGRRIPATPQALLDRNRSRAVASGLSAQLQVESSRSGRTPGDVRTETAADLVRSLVRKLLPELRAMEVTAAELMPVVAGISLRSYYPDAVRTENDLFANWLRAGRAALDPSGLHALLSNPNTVGHDQISEANALITPSGTSVVGAFWTDLLQRRERSVPARGTTSRQAGGQAANGQSRGTRPASRPGQRRDGARAEQQALAEATLLAALAEADREETAIAMVRRHVAAGWRPSLVDALKQVDGGVAKQIRRTLRPSESAVLRLRDDTDIAGLLGEKVRNALARNGNAFIVMDLPVTDRLVGVHAVSVFSKTLPEGILPILVANVTYQAHNGRRVSLEVLVLDTRDSA